MMKTEAYLGVMDMPVVYEQIRSSIIIVLRNRYKLTIHDAESAIDSSPMKQIFDSDPEMTAHTSNEAWARNIYEFWKKNR